VVVDSQNRPVVTFVSDGTPASVGVKTYLRRFDGGTWVELSGSGSGSGLSTTTSQGEYDGAYASLVHVDADDFPIVAWTDTSEHLHPRVLVTRYNGTTWVDQASGIQAVTGVMGRAATLASVIVDAQNQVLLAWADRTELHDNVFVARFDGSTWSEIAPGSASGSGVSASASASNGGSLWADGNEICVTWLEASERGYGVALRCASP
jgi:hypothetical protein